MSDLIRRLRQRAHLPEFSICGEAAAALEAAERERDGAIRRAKQASREKHKAQPERAGDVR
jgi:hypothetical protein